MSEIANATAAVLAQLTKLVKGLSDDDLKRVASGDLGIIALPRPAMKAVGRLTAEDLRQVEDGEARLVLLRPGEKVVKPFDVVEIAAEVAKLGSEAEVVRFLDSDTRLGLPNLKRLADELNIPVPPTVKGKSALQLHIAQAVVRDTGHWNWR